MENKLFHNLAKTELHCHLDGSLSLELFVNWPIWLELISQMMTVI